MVDFILSFISITTILELPWSVQVPGLIILALLAYRALRSLLSLKLIKAITSVIMFFIVAFILSRFGSEIARWIEGQMSQ